MAKKHRIGILGGAFDPVHEGHIHLGISSLDAGLVDELLVVPAGDPPYKTCAAEAEDRWKMVVAACSCDKRLRPSRMEIDRAGTSYAADTLRFLKDSNPGSVLYFILGEDALLSLSRWNRLPEVLSLCRFLVFRRPGLDAREQLGREIRRLKDAGGHIMIAEADTPDISSSRIRTSLALGESPSFLGIPVLEFCSCKGLYGLPGRPAAFGKWIDRLFSVLKPRRFAHSLSVAYTAARLAHLHGIDPFRAEEAGILHDCAKSLPLEEMRRIAVNYSLDCDEAFLSSGALLHSVVGAWVAENEYGMSDPEVLEAIAFHNTGHAGMSRLAMCVCLADSIEPLREDYPGLKESRILSETSLERALLFSLERTSEYVLSRGQFLHPRTLETIRWLRTLPAVSDENKP